MFETEITNITQNLLSVNYSNLIYSVLTTTYLELFTFTMGILSYAIFIWFLYKNLAKRDLFQLDLRKYDNSESKDKDLKKEVSVLLYILKYGIIFPFYVAFWFVILSIFLFVMAKNVTVRQIALISIALVSTIRITSYLSEEHSQDLAKLAPLALLGVFLTDPNFFSWGLLMTRLGTFPSLGWEIITFLTFCILLEWILRILYSIKVAASCEPTTKENEEN